ncbi:unnamed protein product [Rodentolepis nana]|uniref:RNase H type-1 domain-containing protein n=1 Tax=Rodentolepis nana TaxID=102285 RepID=A0A0R3TPF3_RODNA|nr:unnamed protein product [Rodentolepis nana]
MVSAHLFQTYIVAELGFLTNYMSVCLEFISLTDYSKLILVMISDEVGFIVSLDHGVYSELFSFYAAAGHNRSAFEGEIEAIIIALRQLCCLDTKFTKAVILSDSQSAINSIGNRETPKTAEIKECRKLYELLREKNKTVVLQWIPGHCGIKGNEIADTLAKKGTTILQCTDRPMSFHTMKAFIRREFQTSRYNELKARTKEKQWTVALAKNRSRC